MKTRGSRWAVALLTTFSVAALVIVLSPWPLQTVAAGPTDRAIASMHGHGVPHRINYKLTEFVANIALFVPIGALGLLLLRRRPWWHVIFAAAAVSIALECVQGLALPRRTASIWDAAANTAGAVLGLALTAAVLHLRRCARGDKIGHAPEK